jgi:hypothetical protein
MRPSKGPEKLIEGAYKKATCVATSGPSLGSKTAIAGWDWEGGRYRIPLAKTIAVGCSIERRETLGI